MMNDKRTLRDDLIAAKALISNPANWGKERNKDVIDGVARYCTYGALYYAIDGQGVPERECYKRAGRCEDELIAALPTDGARKYLGIRHYNDIRSTSHADIMALFDRAIAAASVQS